MVGVLIISHCHLAEELINAAEFIVGKLDKIEAVSIDPSKSVEGLRQEIQDAIARVDSGDGVLILTDMFGGTPSNISLSFLKEEKVDVVTGVNLPMVIKLAYARKDKKLWEVAETAKSCGKQSICSANQILKKRI
ncbi:MAG TPA: PTS sugar transporter subunit IIA [Syntrophaceae bacterium]|nr:PTS sugar transporter subunit IIA [Syntrophaceae bacterium]